MLEFHDHGDGNIELRKRTEWGVTYGLGEIRNGRYVADAGGRSFNIEEMRSIIAKMEEMRDAAEIDALPESTGDRHENTLGVTELDS